METREILALRIRLASPEDIRSWSHGEVTRPETINYRRLRPEKGGLFCEAIFGPTRDYQCACGKYKNRRYAGLKCDRCEVEVTKAAVRRERMGHIELASPVAHLWYARRVPSYIGLLLDVNRRNLERVLYFAQYVVTYVDEEARKRALERLDAEIGESLKDLTEAVNTRIATIKAQRDRRLRSLQQQRKAIETEYNERIAAQLEPIIREGQRLEQWLQEHLGEVAKEPVYFGATGTRIVDAGARITAEHLSRVQEIVREHLEAIEAQVQEERDQKLQAIDSMIQRIRAEAEAQMEELRRQLDEKTTLVQDEKVRLREELMDLRVLTFLSEPRYRELKSRWGNVFRADMGAEAIQEILKRLDLDALAEELWKEIRTTKSKQKRKKAIRRLRVVEWLRRSNNRPEWMILTVLPVLPPDLRPMVQLDGGRFATSDLNDLYLRVINRNNRLKRLIELGAPEVIIRNEKRMLQEAVDSLIDNSYRGKALSRRGQRELKSLSDMLKGKKGRFRRNLLGKRVDYSGRSVIVVGPKLKLHQCGLPKIMALELYKPFVMAELLRRGYVNHIKTAKRRVEQQSPEVWEILDEVVKTRPVLLNRAPTLHRLSIQAFEPVLIEGKAIELHPLVCTAFNADFDGDQMAVHLPLTEEAVREARELMLSTKNLLKPADGEPIISPSKDMVLGLYYLTVDIPGPHKGDGMLFADYDEVEAAYHLGYVDLHAKIRFRTKTYYDDEGNRLDEPQERIIETTVGRVIFNQVLPEFARFVNWPVDKGGIKDIMGLIYDLGGRELTVQVADPIKDLGFHFATKSGITLAISDITTPEEKPQILAEAQEEVAKVERSFRRGLLTEQERTERVIEIWQETTEKMLEAVKRRLDPVGDLAMMAVSGATKGGYGTVNQLAGMRGMMADPSGRIVPVPIRSNFREGLSILEYFISTHGSRKGLADTALRTADAGYLTRRLVDVVQDVIVAAEDCGTEEAWTIYRHEEWREDEPWDFRLWGRIAAEDVVDPETGEILVPKGQLIEKRHIRKINATKIDRVKVYSPLTCELPFGVCAKCYGLDLGTGEMVKVGTAVGIIAAQSIGEPGTQLTLRTFHTGGVAAGGDITSGLPRVEELLEARREPKGQAIMADIDSTVHIIPSPKYSDLLIIRLVHSHMAEEEHVVPEGWTILVQDGDEVDIGQPLAHKGEERIEAAHKGRVRIEDRRIIVAYEEKEIREYEVPTSTKLLVKTGDKVRAGQALTEGSLNPHRLLQVRGREAVQRYILAEVQKVYQSQGQKIHDKHFEIVLRKMLGRVLIVDPGDTDYLPGDLVNRLHILRINEYLRSKGKRPARFREQLLGITKAALATESWLSAASFQHTIRVLAESTLAGKRDPLLGLKENVIIGKLIPAGTGFAPERVKEALTIPYPKLEEEEEVAKPEAVAERDIAKAPSTD